MSNAIDHGYLLARLSATIDMALVNLTADDREDRLRRIGAGQAPLGCEVCPVDDAGNVVVRWGGRELVRIHRSYLLRREPA